MREVIVDQSAKFWNRIANRYSKQPITDQVAYQKKLEVTRDYLRPEMEILEFGCGTGSTAITHAPYVKHIQAIDISSSMIEIAQEKADAKNIQNVTFRCSSIDEIKVPDQTMDAVLGLSVLHLLDNRDQIIAKVHKMLKPGGFFITSTPCIGDGVNLVKFVVPIGKFLGLIPMVKVFTTRELEISLTDGGFCIDHQSQPAKNKAVFIVANRAK